MKMKQAHMDSMPPKWKQLMERHPAMFEELWRPPECAEGWYDLLDTLMTDLERELAKLNENVNSKGGNDNKKSKNVNLKVMQIKEKFGGLRFYCQVDCPFADAMALHDLVVVAESKSFSICELCGEKGEMRRRGGWMRTLCDAHHQEWVDDGK